MIDCARFPQVHRMKDPYFFGYGSLVNTKSHDYPNPQPATLHGWRRAWVATPRFGVVLLSGVKAPGHSIQGLIASVPQGDWLALDEREGGYDRHHAHHTIEHDLPHAPEIAVYAVDRRNMVESDSHYILLSYLDVVVQGFHELYGDKGVERFFETTDNWHTPILNDRSAPVYPRHQSLTDSETRMVDHQLKNLAATIVEKHETLRIPHY